jgi:hypothetical protein
MGNMVMSIVIFNNNWTHLPASSDDVFPLQLPGFMMVEGFDGAAAGAYTSPHLVLAGLSMPAVKRETWGWSLQSASACRCCPRNGTQALLR